MFLYMQIICAVPSVFVCVCVLARVSEQASETRDCISFIIYNLEIKALLEVRFRFLWNCLCA